MKSTVVARTCVLIWVCVDAEIIQNPANVSHANMHLRDYSWGITLTENPIPTHHGYYMNDRRKRMGLPY